MVVWGKSDILRRADLTPTTTASRSLESPFFPIPITTMSMWLNLLSCRRVLGWLDTLTSTWTGVSVHWPHDLNPLCWIRARTTVTVNTTKSRGTLRCLPRQKHQIPARVHWGQEELWHIQCAPYQIAVPGMTHSHIHTYAQTNTHILPEGFVFKQI